MLRRKIVALNNSIRGGLKYFFLKLDIKSKSMFGYNVMEKMKYGGKKAHKGVMASMYTMLIGSRKRNVEELN